MMGHPAFRASLADGRGPRTTTQVPGVTFLKICSPRVPRPIFPAFLPVILLAGILLPVAGPAHGHETLVLGIHPYQPDQVLLELFTPLADFLEQTTGLPVEIRVGTNYEEHIHAIGTARVDLAFLGPAGYVSLTHLFGEHSLLGKIVTNGEPVFRGHIVVTENSPLRSLQQLAGQRLAFVDRQSTMYLVPYAMMKQAGLTEEDLSGLAFLGSHHNVALGVLAGDFAAGAVKEEVFLKFADRGLRSLMPTMDIPEHVFVASHRLGNDHLALIRAALINLDAAPEGVAVLQSFKSSATAVTVAKDADYDQLRALLRFLDEAPK